jgi:hypothetical protein
METLSLRFEDRFDGASNFLSWEEGVTFLLKEYDFWEIVEKVVPPPTNPPYLEVHHKEEIKA